MTLNDYMIGTTAVGIVIVNGPGGATFTENERLTIVSEVSQGFDILYRLSKRSPVNPHLLFLAEVRTVSLDLDPATVPKPTGNEGTRSSEIRSIEPVWLDQALTKLGYPVGQSGVEVYRQALLAKSWTAGGTPQWAYVVFFTKYPAGWVAYARNRRWITMQYEYLTTGGPGGTTAWGPANIDRVFAHETGHMFDAPDEFTSTCRSSDVFGFLKVQNGNCAATNPASVPCLMKKNTEDVCDWTLGHFGWVDANGDGKLDPLP
ncbi:M12 family metallo-peptidase [Streptomyces hesseae]|uniref:M12 family metallo-peptidase n=1 Tax=Streptomyces hesseae TaxID=3075519 RepID=A0ABU2SSU4_9ACTN|nr:M12 family metallo-peptidase [Streptomyces sp. DSM 40473]MDT0452064.1 M12 family metallo-peptidase [Streptomyces sp. DSM 40473]